MKRFLLVLVAVLALTSSVLAQTAHYTKLSLGPDLCVFQTGSGNPNGSVANNVCDVYLQTNGTASATFWVGAGTTVWNQAVTTLADSAITFTDITTGNASSSAHGYLPKTSGNAYDFFLGDGTFGRTVAAGTLSGSSQPWTFSQTWNNGATTFRGFVISYTDTASGSNSHAFVVVKGGSDQFWINKDGSVQTLGQIQAGTHLVFGDTSYVQTSTRTYFHAPTNRDFAIGSNGSGGPEFTIKVGAVPTLTSGWGTGATISGTNSAGRITIGTTPGASGVLTFSQAWTTNAPTCFATDETSGVVIPAVSTTAAVTITGIFTASDKVSYLCLGWQ